MVHDNNVYTYCNIIDIITLPPFIPQKIGGGYYKIYIKMKNIYIGM